MYSLVWELCNVEIKCELTDLGGRKSIHRDEREQPGINTKNWEPRTPPRPRPVLGKKLLDSGVTRQKHPAVYCSSSYIPIRLFWRYAPTVNSSSNPKLGWNTYSFHSFISFFAPVFTQSNSGAIPSTAT